MGLKKNNPGCDCCECEAECTYCTGGVMPCTMQVEIENMADNNCPQADCDRHEGTYLFGLNSPCTFGYVRGDTICNDSNEYYLWFQNLNGSSWGIKFEIQVGGAYAGYKKELSPTQPFDCYNLSGIVIPWDANYFMDACDYENATITVTSGDLL